jgi:hypothetical protein
VVTVRVVKGGLDVPGASDTAVIANAGIVVSLEVPQYG